MIYIYIYICIILYDMYMISVESVVKSLTAIRLVSIHTHIYICMYNPEMIVVVQLGSRKFQSNRNSSRRFQTSAKEC